MTICSCKFPLIIVDERDKQIKDGKEIGVVEYLSIPIEIIKDGIGGSGDKSAFPIPDMEVVEAESLTGIIGTYMKITWGEPPISTKKYDVVGHIVMAGCPEEDLQCDTKNIYVVYHPIGEWIDEHIIELHKK